MNATFFEPKWLDRTLYPFTHKYARLETGTMHYVDEGEGETLLFVHGTPTWSFLYRDMIQALSKNHRCIAIDHLGFGLSEKPDKFSGLPEDHAENLASFIEKLDLRDITLVVHDFGGPIGLGAGIVHAERIKRVVLMNSWLWATKDNPNVQKIDKLVTGWLGKLLYLNFNFSPRVLLRQGFSNKRNLPRAVHNHYLRPFPDRASRKPLLALAQALAGSSDWYAEQWQRLDRLADKEWLILWGLNDKFLTPDFLARWRERLPHAQVHGFDCGHFVQEEEAGRSVEAIRAFL